MTDHFQAMIDALKRAARESRKAIRKCDLAEIEHIKARQILQDMRKKEVK